ncbi:MAG: hypothetical protein ABFS22_02140 [Pseudomonadota bacterium]
MTQYKAAFTTGNSSGIGLALTGEYLSRGYKVYGTSRRSCPLTHERLHDVRCDLADFETVAPANSKEPSVE